MTDDRMALVDLLQKSGDGDFLRSVAEAVRQILMEADVEGLIGAGRHERSAERLNYRNGYRERSLDTRLGSLQLRIPKLRQGSYFPPFLEPRKTAEKDRSLVERDGAILRLIYSFEAVEGLPATASRARRHRGRFAELDDPRRKAARLAVGRGCAVGHQGWPRPQSRGAHVSRRDRR